MIYECQDCGSRFPEWVMNRNEQRYGKCPLCGSENIWEERDYEDQELHPRCYEAGYAQGYEDGYEEGYELAKSGE